MTCLVLFYNLIETFPKEISYYYFYNKFSIVSVGFVLNVSQTLMHSYKQLHLIYQSNIKMTLLMFTCLFVF